MATQQPYFLPPICVTSKIFTIWLFMEKFADPVLRHLLYVTYWFLSYVSRKVLDKVIFEICEKNATWIIFCVLRFTWGIWLRKVRINLGDPASN